MTLYQGLRCLLMPLTRVLWPTKIINKENMGKVGGALVICNHYTKVDVIIPMRAFFKDELHVVVKAEAFETSKISNWFLRKIGGIPVKRSEADIDAVKAIYKVLKADKKLMIFPEGTRNKEGTKDMAEFKEGAARFAMKTKKPIVPMIFFASPKYFKKNWLYVGEPFTLEQFYTARTAEEYAAATKVMFDKMLETRALCDAYVANVKNKHKKQANATA